MTRFVKRGLLHTFDILYMYFRRMICVKAINLLFSQYCYYALCIIVCFKPSELLIHKVRYTPTNLTNCNVWKNTFTNPLLNAQEMESILLLEYWYTHALSLHTVEVAFINSWYLSLWDACELVQRLGDCSMPVFGLTNCKTAYTCLLHHVVALCCGVVRMGLLNSLIAWPSDPDSCLNSPLMPTTPSHLLPIHPLIHANGVLSKVWI